MTHDEALAALAADPAALVWAGRDFDSVALAVCAIPPVSPEFATIGTLSPSFAVEAARKAIAAATDTAARLVAIKTGADTLAGILAARERSVAEGAALIAERNRRFAEDQRFRQQDRDRREKIGRAILPLIAQVKPIFWRAEAAIGDAVTPAAMSAAHDSLNAELTSVVDTMRQVCSTIMPGNA